MIIHTVSRGECIFSIARKYGISASKIMEYNSLPYPDKLMPGQKLVIFVPTRTYTVRGGDTVAKICKRFEMKKNTLLANNPCLHGSTSLRSGTELSIRFDAPKYRFAALNGYVYNNVSIERFDTMLPYMTYLTFCIENNLTEEMLRKAKEQNKITLLRLPWDALIKHKGDLENALLKIKDKGYNGITLSVPRYDNEKEDEKDILEVKKRLLGKDMLLFCEFEAEAEDVRFDVADGIIALYEKCYKKDIPSFSEGEQRVMERFATRYEAGKTFMELSSFGYNDKEALSMEQIQKIAVKYQAEYSFDETKLISFFDYYAFHKGKKEHLRIHFEAPENIKAKLGLIHELGFIGACVDIGHIPISTVLMLYTTYCGIESPYTGIFGL